MLKLTVLETRHFLTECRTRIPFRFGVVTLERAPLCLAVVDVVTDGGERSRGYASDLLVPKWFEKDPDKPLLQDSVELLESARAAARLAAEDRPEPETTYALWHRLYRSRVETTPESASDRLVRGFGVALLERAVIDAACRVADLSFFAGLQADLFG